jgi:hypothetical protein
MGLIPSISLLAFPITKLTTSCHPELHPSFFIWLARTPGRCPPSSRSSRWSPSSSTSASLASDSGRLFGGFGQYTKENLGEEIHHTPERTHQIVARICFRIDGQLKNNKKKKNKK